MLLAPSVAAQPYSRQIDAFPVRDADGVAYTHPWLGGLNVPRPQLVDIDADGDLDLFIQERPGALIFFENIGSAMAHRFVWRTDAFAGLTVNEWTRFADADGDGDLDMFAEQPFSFIRYYRNDGTPQTAAFTLAADSLKDTQGTPIFSERQNLPALTDIDCDDRLDLFVATLNGRLVYYANEGVSADNLPVFRLVSETFQDIEIIGGFGKTGSGPTLDDLERHGAASITFSDLDNDEDMDLFWGDFFSPSLYFIENTGSCEEPALSVISEFFPIANPLETRGYNAPLFADLDADGDDDLFAGVLGGAFAGGPNTAANFYHYRHDGDLDFALQTRQFISSLDVDEESMPALADLDADGDLDLIVGNKIDPFLGQRAQLFLFENEGTPTAPAFRLEGDLLDAFDAAAARIFNIAPALADLDGDGDVDVLLGQFEGTFALFENEGTPTAPNFVLKALDETTLFDDPTVDIGQNSTPAFADLDGDDDLDLLVGEAGGTFNLFRNVGTPEQPRYTLEAENIGGLDAGARSKPTFHDVTGDDVPDLIVGTGLDEIRVYRTTSTGQTVSFVEAEPFVLPGTVPRLAAPVFSDLDADGDADVVIGGLSGGLFFYRNEAVSIATEDVPAVPRIAVFNYPNPFREATTIRFHLPRPGRVRLVVYDVLGRAVLTPVDGFRAAGEHATSIDTRHLPSGVYFYALTDATGTATTGTMLRVR